MKTALILFAHGARDPEWANPMRRVQSLLKSRMGDMPVELAFLEFMSPSLSPCVDQLIAGGAKKIVILPMFIARGGHLKRELPEMVSVLRSSHPEIEFVLSAPVGENDIVIQAMADAALLAAGMVTDSICP